MATTTPLFIPKQAQEGFIQFHRTMTTYAEKQWTLREQMRKIDLAYLREQDNTTDHMRAKITNNLGDANRIQNITIPVIKPQIVSAVAYQAAVFLSDYPIFGVAADPTSIDPAMQMQAIIEENSIRGAWARHLLLFFIDGFKYNLSAIECTWKKIVTAAIETDVSFKGGKEGKPKQIVWEGNCLERWDPYNIYFDSRCIPFDLPAKGEFVGHTELMSRTALKTFINSLETKLIENIIPAFESPSLLNIGDGSAYGASYYLPQVNSDMILDQSNINSVDWMNWVGLVNQNPSNINYKGIYEVSTEYVRIIPNDFKLRVPSPGTPQIWKLIIVNHSVVIYAERQTNAHEKIPVFFGQPSEDGLGYQSKSLAIDGLPFQQAASALMNSVLASRRRAITDRVLYDPSRVSEAHINSPNPSAKIPVRPAAYGKPVAESVFAFPFRDDQATIALQEVQTIVGFGNILNGQNAARQGQFVKGNKTDSQWQTTMSNATSKDQMTALLYEAQVFTPVKEVLKINILHYQPETTVYSPSKKQNVKIDPIALRNAVINFKVTDGLLPTEKVISSEALKVAMQVIGASPAIGGSYNVGPLFSYIMKTENVNLTPFEKSQEQIAYEQALANWSQLAQLAIQKQAPFNVPQPLPEQFGYLPAQTNPSDSAKLTEPTQ